MVGDDGQRRLLGLDGESAGEAQTDRWSIEQPEDLLVLGLLRAGGIAPGVATALGGLDAELRAHASVHPLGHALRALDSETVGEQLLGELAVGLELGHQLGDLVTRRDRLQRHHVDAGAERPVEVGQADPVMAGLAGEDEPLELARVGRVEFAGSQMINSLPSALQGK